MSDAPATTTVPSIAAPAPAAAATPAEAAPSAAPPAASSTEAPLTNLIADAPVETPPAEAPATPDPNAPPPIFPDFPTLKLPDGVDGKAPETAAFIESFKEAKLTDAQAQALVDKYAGKLVPIETLQQQLDAPNKLWKDTQQQWQTSVKADPEVGGSNLEKNLASIAKVIQSVGGKEADAIKQAFNFTGAGNNPEIVRFMHRIATQLNAEGRTIRAGGVAAVAEKTFQQAAKTIYPSGTATG